MIGHKEQYLEVIGLPNRREPEDLVIKRKGCNGLSARGYHEMDHQIKNLCNGMLFMSLCH